MPSFYFIFYFLFCEIQKQIIYLKVVVSNKEKHTHKNDIFIFMTVW